MAGHQAPSAVAMLCAAVALLLVAGDLARAQDPRQAQLQQQQQGKQSSFRALPAACLRGTQCRRRAAQTTPEVVEAHPEAVRGRRLQAGVRLDAGTGLPFPRSQVFAGLGARPLTLLGTGTATKFGFKAYAVGLYVDTTAYNLRPFRAAAVAAGLVRNQAFFNSLGNSTASKAFVMVLNRNVDKNTMKQALNDGIGATLAAQGVQNGPALVDPIMDNYKADPVVKFSGVILKIQRSSTVVVSYVADVRKGLVRTMAPDRVIASPALARALNTFYLGIPPRTQSLKDNIAATVPALK